jgi:hypothetical protein
VNNFHGNKCSIYLFANNIFEIVYLLHVVQTGFGAHPAPYPMGTRGFFLGSQAAGAEADHSPPTSAEVKNTWIYTSTPPYVFMS